jgi:hypothetical protein
MRNNLIERLCVSAVLLAIAPPAHAAPTLQAEGSICAPNVLICPPVTPQGPAGSVDIFQIRPVGGDPDSVSTNNALIHVYGDNSTTVFGSRSSGHNSYGASGSFFLSETILGIPHPGFAFTIQPGEVTVSGSNLQPGQEVDASLFIRVTLDGVTKFESSRGLGLTDSGPTFDPPATGTDIGYKLIGCGADCLSFMFDSFSTTLDLGVVDPTKPSDLEYVLLTAADGNVAFFTGTTGTTQGMSIARSGDPNGLIAPMGGIVSLPLPVPEPSSGLLVAVGLVGCLVYFCVAEAWRQGQITNRLYSSLQRDRRTPQKFGKSAWQ